MTSQQRMALLVCCFLAMVFDGFELGLMPIASLSVSQSLLGESFTSTLGGVWFARFTASLMLGAAVGGIAFGALGDRIGRTRSMAICILMYSVCAALGAIVQTQWQMCWLRFAVGLGVGGLLPNALSLVSECWPSASRPVVSGSMMAGLNAGILFLSQLARWWPISAESWRWLFIIAGLPIILGFVVLFFLPESPKWIESRLVPSPKGSTPLRELFRSHLIGTTVVAILASSIPMIGAWSASKWMVPWADQVAAATNPGYKAATQGYWALGAVIGSFIGAQLAIWLGRRTSYLGISVGSFVVTWLMFRWTAPLADGFQLIVFIQGWVATLFFGWLSVFLPEIFPTNIRATGSGLAYNSGRFATAAGVLFAGLLFEWLGSDYARVGSACAFIYGAGIIVALVIPAGKNNFEAKQG